jgi:hypothetical protein
VIPIRANAGENQESFWCRGHLNWVERVSPDLHWEATMEAKSIVQIVKTFAPVLGAHPVTVWDTAKEGAQKAADVLPESLGQLKTLIRKHPVVATCAVLAIGGLLSARGIVGQRPA